MTVRGLVPLRAAYGAGGDFEIVDNAVTRQNQQQFAFEWTTKTNKRSVMMLRIVAIQLQQLSLSLYPTLPLPTITFSWSLFA